MNFYFHLYPDGATINRVMSEHGLTNPSAVLDAMNLLEAEGKIRIEKRGSPNHRDGITVYPL